MDEKQLEQPALEPENLGAQNLSENQDGSMFGKFNDAKNLLEAYNNLQAEFTRKSQKLAEFQRKSEENAFFEKDSYANVDEFLEGTGKEKYKKDVTEILANDTLVSNLQNRYQVALKIAEEADRKSADKLANQEFIDENILNNQAIRQKIITDYLSSLKNIPASPKVMSGNSNSVYFSPNENKPKSIKEAGEIFSKMLK